MGVYRIGSEVLVNTGTYGVQDQHVVTRLEGGGFVVVWRDGSVSDSGAQGDDSGYAVKAQIFSASGARMGGEILVNTATEGEQTLPSVTALPNGGFAVAWQDASFGVGGAPGDAEGLAIKAQMFDSDGSRLGDELLLNTTTAGDQIAPIIALVPDLGFQVAWEDKSHVLPDTQGDDVRLQAVSFSGGIAADTERLVNTATYSHQRNIQLISLTGDGNSMLVVWQDASLGVGGAGGDASSWAVKAQVISPDGLPIGDEIRVNTSVTSDQLRAKAAALPDGGFVVTWEDNSRSPDDPSGHAVRAQVFDPAGEKRGEEILVNTTHTGEQVAPVICALGDGFVIVWGDSAADGSGAAVRARVFDSSGGPIGSEIAVNTATDGDQDTYAVSALSNGGFVVAWQDKSEGHGGADGDHHDWAIKAQAFDADGSPDGVEILVNTATEDSQRIPKIVSLDEGFAIVWEDYSEGEGGAGGDEDLSALKMQVFTLHAPPELDGLDGTASFTEGAAPVAVAPAVVVDDEDSDELHSATVSISAGFAGAQDKLDFANATGMGDIQGSYNAATGVMTLTSAGGAAIDEFQDAIRAVTYRNTSDNPSETDRTISVTVNDGSTSSTPATRTLTVTGVNDAPSGADKTITIGEDTPRALTAADFGFSDTDGDAVVAVKFTTTPVNGSLTYDGAPIDSNGSVSVGDIVAGKVVYTPGLNANGAGHASFTFQVRDSGGTDNGGADLDPTPNTITFNVDAVNDAPTLGAMGLAPRFVEGSAPIAVKSNLTVTDVDSTILTSASVSITANFQVGDVLAFTNAVGMSQISGSYDAATGVLSLSDADGATPAEWQAALQAVTYASTLDAPSTTDREVTFTVSDGTDSGSLVRGMKVSGVNDAPAGADRTITIAEDHPHTVEAGDFGFTDVDGNALASVTITGLPAAGALFYDGDEITEPGRVITTAALNSGLLEYRPAANATGVGYASFSFKVTDNGGVTDDGVATDPTANTITYNVTAENDAPTLGGLSGNTEFVEGLNAPSEAVAVAPGITVTDLDSETLASATVSISGSFRAAEDKLDFVNASGMGDIQGSYNAGTGVLTLTSAGGATAEEFQAALRAVTYINTSETPFSSARTLTFRVSDGALVSNVGGQVVQVIDMDDTPSGADATLNMLEDAPRTLTAADFGFSDPDGGTLRGVTITTIPTGGTLKLDGDTVLAGDVINRDDIDSGFLVYRPPANASDADFSFTFQVMDDLGEDYTGEAVDQSANTLTFHVGPVSDAPAGSDGTITAGEDGSRALTVADFGFTDTDGDSLAAVKIVDLPAHGALTLDGVAVSANQTIQAADIAAGKLVFAPQPGQSGAAYATIVFQVQDDGSMADGGQTVDPSFNTLTIDVSAAPPPPPPSTPSQPTVDGVPVTTTTGTGSDGEPSQTVVIPVVQPGRTDSVGGNNVADIPIVTGGGTTLLSVQAPAGYGLTASGPSTAQTAGTSLTDLIREIQAHTAAGSADQTSLTGGGSGFLGSLTASTPLLVQTIVPTGGGAGAAPLVINGTAAAAGDPMTALVIDTRGLPSGSAIQLNNVEFAAVIGNVTVTGGAGSQTVFGDGASQNLFLGADDDELHGGGGVDTVSSAGGADRLYGDDGNDSVSGGIGDDYVHGNAGSDTVSGGEGNDLAYGGKDNDRVNGDGGSDLIFGDLGDDFLQGNAGTDTLDGGAGNDTVHGGQDADQVNGGDGNDAVLGDAGDDAIQGGLGNDTATGGSGSDLIHGGQGNDVIYGEAGNDWLSGDKGSDTISGGAGADTFHANAQTGLDWVTDFNFAEGDKVLLDLGTTYSVSQGASGVVIDITGGAQMVLAGVQLASLGEGWIGLG